MRAEQQGAREGRGGQGEFYPGALVSDGFEFEKSAGVAGSPNGIPRVLARRDKSWKRQKPQRRLSCRRSARLCRAPRPPRATPPGPWRPKSQCPTINGHASCPRAVHARSAATNIFHLRAPLWRNIGSPRSTICCSPRPRQPRSTAATPFAAAESRRGPRSGGRHRIEQACLHLQNVTETEQNSSDELARRETRIGG